MVEKLSFRERLAIAVTRMYCAAAWVICALRGHQWRMRDDLWPAIDGICPACVADVCDRCASIRDFRVAEEDRRG